MRLTKLLGLSLISTSLAQCVNDGVCTLNEFKEHCPDCLVHNVTYPNVTHTTTSSGMPIWIWVLAIILLVFVLGIVAVAVYFVYRKRKKHKKGK